MQDEVGALESGRKAIEIGNIQFVKLDAPGKSTEIFALPGDEVIHHADLVASPENFPDQRRTDKQRLTNEHECDAANHGIADMTVGSDRNEFGGGVPRRERSFAHLEKENDTPTEQ